MNRLLDKMVLGALAGFSATLPMTATMEHLHRRLPAGERYPLPPREISEDLPRAGLGSPRATLLYHFVYGAVAGALFGFLCRRRDIGAGSCFGIGVWAASYLGWLPASRVLKPATAHPARRNSLMLAAHVVWGACLSLGLNELERAAAQGFSTSGKPEPRLIDRTDTERASWHD